MENNIFIDGDCLKSLIKKYPGAKGIIEKQTKSWEKTLNKKPFKEQFKDIYLQEIKDNLTFVNLNYKEKGIEFNEEQTKQKLKLIYEKIINVLKKFCDLKEDYYSVIALWIIGTYIHDEFETYPYLFFNAMRGSGKTRILKLIASMSNNGEVLGSLSEAVLFRTAKGRTICIDEFEKVGSHENQALRELLNAAYKKGQKIKRMKKAGDEYVVEEFDIYTPICMANIWGMDEVLGDRCITIVLEKSNDLSTIKLIENFSEDEEIIGICQELKKIQCSLCMYVDVKTLGKEWNNFILKKYNKIDKTTLNTLTTLTTHNTLTTLFNKIDSSDISGRELELSIPFFIIAGNLEIIDQTIKILKNIMDDKKAEYLIESKDIQIFDFVSQQDQIENFISITKLTNKFRDFIGVSEKEDNWINVRWFGRALKRLVLAKEKRRRSGGMEVILDIQKAQEKMKMFK